MTACVVVGTGVAPTLRPFLADARGGMERVTWPRPGRRSASWLIAVLGQIGLTGRLDTSGVLSTAASASRASDRFDQPPRPVDGAGQGGRPAGSAEADEPLSMGNAASSSGPLVRRRRFLVRICSRRVSSVIGSQGPSGRPVLRTARTRAYRSRRRLGARPLSSREIVDWLSRQAHPSRCWDMLARSLRISRPSVVSTCSTSGSGTSILCGMRPLKITGLHWRFTGPVLADRRSGPERSCR